MPASTSDYRYEVRAAAFQLLADRQYDALYALHGTFLDRASHAFDGRDDARRNGDDALAEYWTQVRATALELADQIDAAVQHIPDTAPTPAPAPAPADTATELEPGCSGDVLYCECDACNALDRDHAARTLEQRRNARAAVTGEPSGWIADNHAGTPSPMFEVIGRMIYEESA